MTVANIMDLDPVTHRSSLLLRLSLFKQFHFFGSASFLRDLSADSLFF